MTKIELTKTIAKTVVGTSTSFTVARVLTANAPVSKTHEKVEVTIGSIALGMMVAEKAEAWTNEKIDVIHDWWKSNVKDN